MALHSRQKVKICSKIWNLKHLPFVKMIFKVILSKSCGKSFKTLLTASLLEARWKIPLYILPSMYTYYYTIKYPIPGVLLFLHWTNRIDRRWQMQTDFSIEILCKICIIVPRCKNEKIDNYYFFAYNKKMVKVNHLFRQVKIRFSFTCFLISHKGRGSPLFFY